MEEFDIENIANNLDFNSNSFQNINGMMLTNREIEVLDKYHIPYKNCHNLKEIIDDELDYISSTISERDYYENTNK